MLIGFLLGMIFLLRCMVIRLFNSTLGPWMTFFKLTLWVVGTIMLLLLLLLFIFIFLIVFQMDAKSFSLMLTLVTLITLGIRRFSGRVLHLISGAIIMGALLLNCTVRIVLRELLVFLQVLLRVKGLFPECFVLLFMWLLVQRVLITIFSMFFAVEFMIYTCWFHLIIV